MQESFSASELARQNAITPIAAAQATGPFRSPRPEAKDKSHIVFPGAVGFSMHSALLPLYTAFQNFA